MPDELGYSQRTPGVAGSGLNPDGSKWPLPEQPPVADTIEGHFACQAEVIQAGLFVQCGGRPQHHLLDDLLNRARQVHLALSELGLRGSAGTIEQVDNGQLLVSV